MNNWVHPINTPCWNVMVGVLLYEYRFNGALPPLSGGAWQTRRNHIAAAIYAMSKSYGLDDSEISAHFDSLAVVVRMFKAKVESPTVLSDRIIATVKLLSNDT